MKPKIITIVGPTGSGKTSLSIELAQKFNGEIISADSRAIYRGLDIGTAKPTPKERRAVRHHLIDIVNVGERFTVVQFQALARQTINGIARRNKIPLIVGGTGLYIDALLYGYEFPPEGDPELRYHLEQESDEKLREMLRAIDLVTYQVIDLSNRRRVIRALEVVLGTGRSFVKQKRRGTPNRTALVLGIDAPRPELYRRIDQRFEEWIEHGLLEEVRWVLDETSPYWVASLGLHYKWLAAYIQGDITKEEAITRSKSSLHAYAKRQMTWWKRNKGIKWVGSKIEAERLIRQFLDT